MEVAGESRAQDLGDSEKRLLGHAGARPRRLAAGKAVCLAEEARDLWLFLQVMFICPELRHILIGGDQGLGNPRLKVTLEDQS